MSSSVRASPFRETEWDRRFNNLMDDLENSAAANVKSEDSSHYYSQSPQPHSKASNSSSTPLAPDNVLRDLNSALNASSNYIENHRTETGPGSMTEYHEYKTYSTSTGAPPDFDLQEKVQHMMPSSYSPKTAYSPLHSANMVSSLQQQSSNSSSAQKTAYSSRQVQNSSSSYNTSKTSSEQVQDRPGSRLKQNIEELDTLLYDLNNAQKMSDTGGDYTASSITPGQISSDDYSFSEGGQSIHQDKVRHASHAFNEYSTSSEAKPPSPSPRRRFPSSSGQAVLTSPASVRKAAGHHVYQTTTTTTTKTVREHSPYDYQRSSTTLQDNRSLPTSSAKNIEYHKTNNNDYSRTTTLGSSHEGGTNSDYGRTTPIPVVHEYNTGTKGNQDHHSISRSQEYSSRSGFSQQEMSSRSTTSQHDYGRTTTSSQSELPRGVSPGRERPSVNNDTLDYSRTGTMPSNVGIGDGGEPKGAAYYAKYHSSHTHKSQQQQHQTTHSFPASGRNTPSFPTNATQQPPKRVDELMTELSEFDPSIQPTTFVEPRPVNKMTHTTYKHREDDTDYLLKKESSLDGGGSNAKDSLEPMPNIAGPAVYYPPGEMFSSETAVDSASAPLNPSGKSKSSSKKSKGHDKSKEKGKGSDSDGKQGAAVVPICLPLCCAAPCVIM